MFSNSKLRRNKYNLTYTNKSKVLNNKSWKIMYHKLAMTKIELEPQVKCINNPIFYLTQAINVKNIRYDKKRFSN